MAICIYAYICMAAWRWRRARHGTAVHMVHGETAKGDGRVVLYPNGLPAYRPTGVPANVESAAPCSVLRAPCSMHVQYLYTTYHSARMLVAACATASGSTPSHPKSVPALTTAPLAPGTSQPTRS
jgi:hypothetical protein